jgi:glycosyltransferase involved in cell wall biosynthesis
MGAGEERKGRDASETILRATREKYGNKVAFLIFGSGADAWKNHPHVYSAGLVRGADNMARLYNASDLFVFPTKAENLANVAIESMACGVPVLSYNVGGMSDLIEPSSNGVLVPLGQLETLISSLSELIGNPGRRSHLAQSCRETILQKFTQEREIAQMLEVYASSVERFA